MKSSERVQDSSDDEGDVSRVRRALAYPARKGKSKAQPGIDYTSPLRQAARVAKKTPAEDGFEDGSDPASDNDASYRIAQSFHTGTPSSHAVDTNDALDSSDNRPAKRSKVTGKRISVRLVGAAGVGKIKTGAFDPEELFKLDKFRDDFCREHAITVQTFNSMMEDTSKAGAGHKWPWDRYVSKRALTDDYYNLLPGRDKKSLRRYKDRSFTNLEQNAPWTMDDDEMLMEMVKEKGNKWKAIGQEIGRTEDAVHQRYKHKLRHGEKAKTGTWTNEEIEALESAIMFCKSKAGNAASGNEQEVFWTEVSDRMGGTRTAQQCSRHWRRVQRGGERPIRYAFASTVTPKVRRTTNLKKKPASGKTSVKSGKTGTEEKPTSRRPVKRLDFGGNDSDDPIEDEGPMEQFASVKLGADVGRQLENVPKIQGETLPMQTEVALEVPPIHPQELDFDDAWAQQEAWQKEQERKLAKEKAKRTQKGGKRKKTTARLPTQPTSSVVENRTHPQPQQAVEQQDRSEVQEALEQDPIASDGTDTQDEAVIDKDVEMKDNASTSSDEERGVSASVVVEEEQDEAEESKDEEGSGSDDDEEETGSEEVSGSEVEEDSNDSMVKATRVDYARSREGKDARSDFTDSIKKFAAKMKKTSQHATWGRKATSDNGEDDDEDE